MTPVLAAGLLLATAPAQAQADTVSDRVFLQAEELIEDREAGVYRARGTVELRSGDRVLYADELVYDPTVERVTARGNVRIFDGDQPAQLADEVVLDESLEEGVARGFATLLENNGRAAAAAALRRPGGTVELTGAYYTACELCTDDPDQQPTWRLRASRVVRDVDNDMIYYRNARLEVLGRPVLYSPVFAHADPSTPRRSGFLFPTVDVSNRLGFSYQQPYLWVISPSQDLTIAPRYMSKVNPLLQLDWRKRFYSGQIDVETSVTYEQEFDQDGFFGDEELRGHVFANGLFALSADWRWGFGIQAATEDLYLRRYDFNEAPSEEQALFSLLDPRTLINQVFAAGSSERYYADVSTVQFDRLAENFDDDRLPRVIPWIRADIDLPLPDSAGNLDLQVNAVALRRELGDDYARASVGVDWERPTILAGGVRAEAFAVGRVDAYAFNTTDSNGTELESTEFVRARAAAGLDVSYPLVRSGSRFDLIVAPRTALIVASGGDPDERPNNVDSQVVDFDRSLFFEPVRSPGFDVWEDGARLDLGLTVGADFHTAQPARLEAFVGQSHRLDGDERFGAGSGLAGDNSDWVADLTLDIGQFSGGARTRVDNETGDLNRLEAFANVRFWRANLRAEYTDFTGEDSGRPFEEMRLAASFEITDEWSAFYDGVFDQDENEARRQRAGVSYRDECTAMRIFWQRENISFGNLGPSESLKFEIALFTLGGVGSD